MAPPLTDVRVLDLSTGPVGGIATMVLADFGAEIVNVEPVGGDPWRSLGVAPMWMGQSHDGAFLGVRGEEIRTNGLESYADLDR